MRNSIILLTQLNAVARSLDALQSLLDVIQSDPTINAAEQLEIDQYQNSINKQRLEIELTMAMLSSLN